MILGRKRVFTISKAIVKVIVQYLMFPAAYGDYDDDGEGPPSGDRCMNVLFPQYIVANDGAKVVPFYIVTI